MRDGTARPAKGYPMPKPDLDFRPASYWDHADPVSAILSGIKGQNRREMARDFITGRAPGWLGEIDAGLLGSSVDDRTRGFLGATDPRWMGGEYLPDYLPGEVEIARLVLDSSTRDVISFRARGRRRTGRNRIRYRVVDEYHEPGRARWTCRLASSARPLSLREMIALIDGARSPDYEPGYESLADSFRDAQNGVEPEDLVDFVRVESDFYPGLAGHFEREAAVWLMRKRVELGDEG